MKKFRWQILIVLLALVAIAVLLWGQQPNLLPALPEVQPATGGTYTEALVGSMGRLNPLLDYYSPVDRDVDSLIFSGLVRIDDRGLPQLDLAESMGISQDGEVYNFSLRPGAVWHDGEPLTSADVIFTIDLLRSEDLPIPPDERALWNEVEVEALNDETLQFRLPEPYSPFLDHLTFGILPSHLLGDLSAEQLVNADFNLEPVGSGPYRFENLIVEDDQIAGVALSAFEDYYDDPAFIEEVNFRYYPDAQTAFEAYQAGTVQGINKIPVNMLPEALAEPGLNLYTGRLPQLAMVFFNLDNPEVPFLQDANVRRALLMGINRQRMIDELLQGQAIIADGPIFPGTWAYFENIERINYDPDGAIALLREAGYTIPAEGGEVRANEEGVFLSLELIYPEGGDHGTLVEAIARDWRRLGVEVETRAIPYETLVTENLDPRIYQATLVDLNLTRSPDPDPYAFWHQTQITGGQNYSKWDDRPASEYIEQARVTVDIAERTRLYRNFQVRFTTEMPALPLFYPVYTYAVADQVQGVTMGPLFEASDRFSTITSWFLEARRTVTDNGTPEPEATGPPGSQPSEAP